jgi:hypothetical protein
MLGCLLPGLVGCPAAALEPVHQRAQAPQLAQAAIIVVVLEGPADPLMDLTGLSDCLLGVDLDPQEQLLDHSVPLQAFVAV